MTTLPTMLDWQALPGLPLRSPAGHKGNYGHVHVLGGHAGMGGAAALAALAAYRSGAGLVTVWCHADNMPYLAAWVPEALWGDWSGPLPTGQGAVLALGPGLQTGEDSRTLLARWMDLAAPQVWDADALNLLARYQWPLSEQVPVRILTPHPGEAGRLLGVPTGTVQRDRAGAAREIAKRFHGVCILKGHHSLISDGQRLAECPLGNPGMATGGAGDVLTGITAALLGQGLDAWQAAVLGVCLHARAGDRAADARGQASLIARDLIDWIPAALREKG